MNDVELRGIGPIGIAITGVIALSPFVIFAVAWALKASS